MKPIRHLMVAALLGTATALPAAPVDQASLDRLAETLDVRYTILGNRLKGKCPAGEPCLGVRIRLTSPTNIPITGWTLSLSQLFPIRRVESAAFTASYVTGDLVRIAPNRGFTGFRAGKPVDITLYLKGQHGNEFEAMPNYWLAAPGLQPRTIRATMPVIDPETGLERLPFLDPMIDEERQFRIDDNERIQWQTPSRLYAANATRPPAAVETRGAILPTPVELRTDPAGRSLDVSRGLRLSLSDVERDDLAAALARLGRQGIREAANGVPLDVAIRPGGKAESYRLTVGGDRIGIVAADAAGAFYAVQSLASLAGPGARTIPRATVTDAPRFEFRGLHLDVARNFHSKALVLSLLDQMAALKLNRFHFHLGDDEGWRVQIPGLPELTEVGARRCDDREENHCLSPQLGAGPAGVSPINGYYTVADFQEILRAAAARHIQVIPSFDMPGHSRAAVRAMEARYRRYMSAGDPVEASRYRLVDPADRSVYASIQNYHDNTMNPCVPGPYAFVDRVVGEVQAMYADIGLKLDTYHIGADETAGAWRDSPACKALFANPAAGVTKPEQLGGHFIERLGDMLTRRGIRMAAWSDGLSHANPAKLPAGVQSNEWLRLVDNVHKPVAAHVNRGWNVVLSIPDASYFDFPSLADPKERGYYWASRQTDERRVFDYMPDNIPALAEEWTDSLGLPLALDDRAEPMARGRGIAGVQAQIWSETLRSDDQVEYMAFPRLAFFAERAWHRADWEVPYDHRGAAYSPTSGRFTPQMRAARDADWNRVAATVTAKVLPELDRTDIAYRIPVPGARIEGGMLSANLILPGLPVEYRVGGGAWQRYAGPVHVGTAPVEVRALSPDGRRRGRAVPVR